MKLAKLLLVVLVLFLAVMPSGAAQRIVFMEDFTNASCGPCALLNPGLRAMFHAMGPDTVVAIAWHVWWPGGDPMYSYNQSEVQTRTNYYGVASLGVPHVRVDGVWNTTGYSSGTVNLVASQIRSRYSAVSPCTIEFAALATGATGVQVIGTIHAEQDMLSTNLRLFAALIADTIQYASPPGSNGETLFPHVFRDAWPNGSGQAFTVAAGQDYEFTAQLVRAAAWDVADLEVVVWVQDYSTRTVHQAGMVRVQQNYAMETQSASARQLIWSPDGGEVAYQVELINTGALGDTYDVNLEGEFPTGWTRTVEAPGVPADPEHIQVTLASNEQATLTVRINPNGVVGSVDFGVHVTTPSEPLLSATESFLLMSGLDLLLVDDDEGGNRETWYWNALQAAGSDMIMGRWNVAMDPLSAEYLGDLDVVVWFTGDGFTNNTTITEQDQAMLAQFLDNGGRLFLSGQGIGFDCRTDPFYLNYLHAVYRQNYPGHVALAGIEGDPITDGLDVVISGGDGANNQNRQSSMDPDDSGFAAPIFEWDVPPSTGGYPALRVATDIYRLIYLGFGFEAINSPEDRNLFMERSLEWLMGSTSADEPRAALPAEFALGQNFPNPFNPETVIPYVLPERAQVTLRMFDVLGREVATLNPGLQDAGSHELNWNASDLSSGIYFYRLEAVSGANVRSATRKLMLLK